MICILLRGKLDLLVEAESGELIPVEFKTSSSRRGKPMEDHKYQLTAYALLVEECFKKPVKRGVIVYMGDGVDVVVQITPSMKRHVAKALQKMVKILEMGVPPKARVNPRKCTGGCGYKWICQQAPP